MSIPKYHSNLYGSSLVKPFSFSYQWTKSALYPSPSKYNIITECAIRSLKLLTGILALSITALPALAGRLIQIIHFHLSKKNFETEMDSFFELSKHQVSSNSNLIREESNGTLSINEDQNNYQINGELIENNKKKTSSSKSPKISISINEWDPKEEQDLRAYRHLDLGSANYGPEHTHLGESYIYSSKRDPEIEKNPRAIVFHMAKHVIDNQKKYNKFIFYINDISPEGLNEAAINLKNCLNKEYLNRDLTIRIAKIAGDVFKIDFPKVNSASFLHPFNRPLVEIFYEDIYKNEKQLHKPFIELFHKIKTLSETGLLVKEVNLGGGMGDFLQEKISSPIEKNNLKLEPTDASFIPGYRLPYGELGENSGATYRVVENWSIKK